METSAIVLAVVVGFFGLGSAVLGFIAEGTKLTRADIKVSATECVYPANPAFALGLLAALLLLVAQIIVSAVTGCCGCCKPPGGGFSGRRRTIGVVLGVFSWMAAAVAELFYVDGASWNAPMKREIGEGCNYAKDGVFRRAAVLSITATVLGIKSYVMLRAAAVELRPDGIAMGQPVAPVYGQAPYGHYPPPPPAQGYAHFPPPPDQGYGHFPPPAPDQGYGHFPPSAPDQGYGHFPPSAPDQGYGHFPPSAPDQGYGHFPPSAPDQGYGHFPPSAPDQGYGHFPPSAPAQQHAEAD